MSENSNIHVRKGVKIILNKKKCLLSTVTTTTPATNIQVQFKLEFFHRSKQMNHDQTAHWEQTASWEHSMQEDSPIFKKKIPLTLKRCGVGGYIGNRRENISQMFTFQ